MNRFIIQLINMNITAAYVIAVIYIVRLFIKRMPKIYSYILWIFAGFRLIFPFSVSSVFSLFNISFLRNTEYMPVNIVHREIPPVNTAPVSTSVNTALDMGVTSVVDPIKILFLIWLGVFLAILIYKIVLYIKTAEMVNKAVIYRDNIYQCDNIPTPFVMGIFKPKIYIPFRMSEREMSYIVCHERHHIKRHDTLIKATASLLVSIHWFDPLVWLAYRSMTADMEESCDEAVIEAMGEEIKGDYSASILSFALNRRPMSISFGEGSAEKRIKNVISYKSPKRIIAPSGIVLIIIAAFICTTDPMAEGPSDTRVIIPNANDTYAYPTDAPVLLFANGSIVSEKQVLTRNGITYVPVRAIAEKLNVDVEQQADTLIIKNSGMKVTIGADTPMVTVYGKQQQLNAPPLKAKGSLYISAEDIGTVFRCSSIYTDSDALRGIKIISLCSTEGRTLITEAKAIEKAADIHYSDLLPDVYRYMKKVHNTDKRVMDLGRYYYVQLFDTDTAGVLIDRYVSDSQKAYIVSSHSIGDPDTLPDRVNRY